MKKLALNILLFTTIIANANAAFESKMLESRFASWGISPYTNASINLEKAWKNFKKKKEVVVAVVDTGIDPNHPFLSDNLVSKNSRVDNFGRDFSKNTFSPLKPSDSHGHGTHVSGIIKSIFPDVKILTLKYYNPTASGEDNLASTIKALKYAVEQNVDIINYSGGGPEASAEELAILKIAEKKGILVVAASGNNGSNIDIINDAYYPASYGLKNIITVTAHDQMLQVLNSSNYGVKTVDIAAPGYRIRSTLPKGRSGFLTGTSQATAFVTGVAALLKSQYPKLSAKKIKEIIKLSARQEVTLASKCKSQGRLDAAKALEVAARDLSPKTKVSSLQLKSSQRVGKIIYRKVSSKK